MEVGGGGREIGRESVYYVRFATLSFRQDRYIISKKVCVERPA